MRKEQLSVLHAHEALSPGIMDDPISRPIASSSLSSSPPPAPRQPDGGERTGGRHMTGTMEFMAIDVLRGVEHTYRHDLESFFYLLLWMCARRAWERRILFVSLQHVLELRLCERGVEIISAHPLQIAIEKPFSPVFKIEPIINNGKMTPGLICRGVNIFQTNQNALYYNMRRNKTLMRDTVNLNELEFAIKNFQC